MGDITVRNHFRRGRRSIHAGQEADHCRPITYQERDQIWRDALKSAKKIEDKYGLENLGPWDDFEWGMINGKLSALRWLTGFEWDMLDT